MTHSPSLFSPLFEQYSILEDGDHEPIDFTAEQNVTLLRKASPNSEWRRVGRLRRAEAQTIVSLAFEARRLREHAHESELTLGDRKKLAEHVREAFPASVELVHRIAAGWWRERQGRERAPRFSRTSTAPDDGHGWTQLWETW